MNKVVHDLDNYNTISLQKLRKEQEGHRLSIQIVKFSYDGNYLLSGDWLGAVKLWRITDSKISLDSTVFFLDEPIEGLQFSKNGQFLCAGTESKLLIHELVNGKLTTCTQILPEMPIRGGLFSFSPDSNQIAIITYDNDIVFYDIMENTILGTIKGIPSLGGSNSNALAWHDNFIYLGLMNGNIAVYSTTDLTLVSFLENGHTDSVLALSVSTNNTLISVGADGRVVIWNLESLTLDTKSDSFERSIICVDGSIDSDIVVYGTDRENFIWNSQTNENYVVKLSDKTNSSIAVSPDGELLVRGTNENNLTVYSIRSSKIIQEILGRQFSVTDSLITNSGEYILCGGDDNKVHIFDTVFDEINALEGHTESISGIAISDDDTRLISSGYDDKILIWNTSTGDILKKIENVDLPNAVAYFSDGIQNSIVLGCAGDFSVRFYDLNGKLIHKKVVHEDYIGNIISYAKQGVFTVSNDGQLIFWNNKGESNPLIKSYQQLTAFSKSDKHSFFFLGGNDGQLEVWNSNNLSLIARYELNEPITSMKLDESEKWLLISCQFTVFLLNSQNIPESHPILINEHEEPIKSVLWNVQYPNTFYSISIGAGVHQYEINLKNQDYVQETVHTSSFESQLVERDQPSVIDLSAINSKIRESYRIINAEIQKIASTIQEEVPEEQYKNFEFVINNMKQLKSILSEDLKEL